MGLQNMRLLSKMVVLQKESLLVCPVFYDHNYVKSCAWTNSKLLLGYFFQSFKYIINTQEALINSYSAIRNNWCTVGGDGGCRVGEVRAGTTSPMPDHKGFKLQ